jgi:hypothetical protein
VLETTKRYQLTCTRRGSSVGDRLQCDQQTSFSDATSVELYSFTVTSIRLCIVCWMFISVYKANIRVFIRVKSVSTVNDC